MRHQDASQIVPRLGDTNCVNMAPAINTEGRKKTRTVIARRHDTLCVRGVFSLFLLEQCFAVLGDSNPGGKTTLIVTLNTHSGSWVSFQACGPQLPYHL